MHWSFRDIRQINNSQLQEIYDRLSPSRKEHIDRLKKPEDRIRSLAAEWLLLQMLQEQYGITNAVLHRHPGGQPYLTGCDLQVSISHCEYLVACAVDTVSIGIDVEQLRPVSPALCNRICVEEEKAYLLAGAKEFPAQERQDPAFLQRFFQIWTAKEAYFKKCGTGITNLQGINTLTLQRQIHRIDDYILQII